MPASVTLAVLAAAVTHATWNALAHRIKDQLVAFGLIGIGAIVVAIPLIVVAAVPRAASWPFLLASIAIHVFYTLFLMRSFTYGDFGQVYPLARGTSPLVVTVLGAIFAAEVPTIPQIAGVLIVSAGMATLVLAGRRDAAAQGKPSRAAILAALATGLTIATYTVVDGIGVRRSGSPVGYIAWLMLLMSLCVPAWAIVKRRHALRHLARPVLASGLLAGALSVLAYGLVLWAQTRGALAPIAALRETSVIFGALIAALAFREPFGRARIVAATLVAAGILVLTIP
jgi:drug/metabolite transporter (DMT)-like permease